ANWLIQNMNAMRDRQESPDEFLVIVNQAGIIYGDGDNKLFLNDLGHLNYIQEIINSTDHNGHFQLELDGKPFILTYSKLDNLSLSFISGIPVEKVTEFKSDLRNFTIILVLLILIIGIAASYYVSKSMLSPLKLLETKMRGL